MGKLALIVSVFWGAYLLYEFAASHRVLRVLLPWLREDAEDCAPPASACSDCGPARLVVARRLAGGLILGGAPVVVFGLVNGLGPGNWFAGGGPLTTGVALAVLPALIPIIAVASRSSQSRGSYPRIRESAWTPGLVMVNAASWSVYLLGYELMFRGALLMHVAPLLGVVPALVLSTVLYSAVHLPKGAGEAIGAIPIGILFGWLTLRTGSILAAWVGHVLIAVTAETVCLMNRSDGDVVLEPSP